MTGDWGYRLFGLTLVALGIGLLWYARPDREGRVRYPARFRSTIEDSTALIVTVLIGLGLPFLLIGAPGYTMISPGAQ